MLTGQLPTCPGFGLFFDGLLYNEGAIGNDDGAAAAAGAVFGTVFLLWRPLAFIVVLVYDLCFPDKERPGSGQETWRKKIWTFEELKQRTVGVFIGKKAIRSLPTNTADITRAHTV